MRKKSIVILYVIFILFIIISNTFNVMAANSLDALYAPVVGNNSLTHVTNSLDALYAPVVGNNPLTHVTNYILGIIKWGGTAILIGVIILKGIKYVTVAPEGKAAIKQDIIMLAVGAILLFSCVTFIDIIYTLVQNSQINSI